MIHPVIRIIFLQLLAASILFSSSSFAAPAGLSVEAAIEEGRKENPDLRGLELAADAASWKKLETLAGHLPHISFQGSHFFDVKYARLGVIFNGTPVYIPSAYPQTTLEVDASLLLFDGLGTINQFRAARLESDAARLDFEVAKFMFEEKVRLRFNQALAAQQLDDVAEQNIKTLEDHLNLVKASERAGTGTKVDVLRIESLLEEARAERILADDNVILARRNLAEEMGKEQDDRPLEGQLPVPEMGPEKDKVTNALKFDISARADVVAQTKREQAQDRLNSAAAAFWFPTLSLFAAEQWYKYGTFDPAVIPNANYLNAYSVGLKLSWNLFDGGASIARKAIASDSAEQAVEKSKKAQISSPNQFETWKRRFKYNAALYRARQRSVEKSEESSRLAILAAKAGTKTHSDVLDAELDLFRARAGVISAQVAASEAYSNLQLALGHRL